MTDILIIEDDNELRGLLEDFMVAEGFQVKAVPTAEEGIAFLDSELARLILLDLMLPGIDGFAACSFIREHKDIPIIMMSARSDDESKLMGYKLGADDYIDKPISIQILTAKIRALLHRSETTVDAKEELQYENITIDISKRAVFRDGNECEIRGKLFDLLLYFMRNKGKLLLKEDLIDAVWGDAFVEQSTLSVHVRWLRERIEEEPDNPKLIKTVWRKGYIFGDDN